MPEHWSIEEVAATVADYFAMLDCERRREQYNKAEHNRRLQLLLNKRTAGAIEFKHANISAILIELGVPPLDGYKPRSNYQELLRQEVQAHLERHPEIADAALIAVDAPAATPHLTLGTSDVLVAPPVRTLDKRGVYDRIAKERAPVRGVNYLEREARNASLGAAGEMFAMAFEEQRLREAGKRHLAGRIEHVARTKGDGLGYDILSFEKDGRERLIEVKTTSFGVFTPFFASKREVDVSVKHSTKYRLYRLFKFRDAPKLFVLPGALDESCTLDPIQFRASVA